MFASEVRTLLKTGWFREKSDPTGVFSYLAFGSVSEPWTIVEGVKAVPAGHLLVWRTARSACREYWNPLRAGEAAQADQLPVILRDAVMSHLVSDVPVGVFFSGGIDSSALVAVLSHNGVQDEYISRWYLRKQSSMRARTRGRWRGGLAPSITR